MGMPRPDLRYTRIDEREMEEPLVRALRLMRDVEGLLENTTSLGGVMAAPVSTMPASTMVLSTSAPRHSEVSTRIARAMASSLIDELEAVIARRKSRSGAA